MNPRVKHVQYKSPYKLILTFTNQEVKEFDFKSYLSYPAYEILREETFAQKAAVSNGTVRWDADTDFDPDTLYLDSKSV